MRPVRTVSNIVVHTHYLLTLRVFKKGQEISLPFTLLILKG